MFAEQFGLNVNLNGERGIWKGPNAIGTSGDSITFQDFAVSSSGLYQFFVTNWNDSQVLAIQIELNATGKY